MRYTLLLLAACTGADVVTTDSRTAKNEWHPLNTEAAELQYADGEISLRLSGYSTAEVNGYTRVGWSDHALLTEKGLPELPVARVNVPVADGAEPTLQIISEKHIDVRMAAPLPARGIITRDINPATVPYEPGPFYTSKKQYPEQAAVIGEPFTVRDLRGVAVQLQPFSYDAGSGTLRVYTELRVRVQGAQATHTVVTEGAFAPVYQSTFSIAVGAAVSPIPEPGRMIILSPDNFVAALQPLKDWKTRRGMNVQIKKLSEVGANANAIKSYLASEYANGLTYVILVGDGAQMPTLQGGYERADCDACYAMVAGNDYYPDFYISRISATTPEQVSNQVAKFVAYERSPDTNGEWYQKAIGVASDEGSPTDWERAELLRDTLEKYGYTKVHKLYDRPGTSKAALVSAVNEGASILNYIGHGAGTYWVTTGFSVSDVSRLNNGAMLPYVFDVACQNGAFIDFDQSLAEAMLRSPAGALAQYAASTNAAWVPPTVAQKWAMEAVAREQHMSLGALSFGGAGAVLAEYPDGDGQMFVEQYILFGDASVQLRTKKPSALSVTHPSSLTANSVLDVQVTGAARATVVLSAKDVVAVADTDASGVAHLDVAGVTEGQLDLTVTALNAVPYEATLTVAQ